MFAKTLRFFDTLRRILGAALLILLIAIPVAALLSTHPSVPDGAWLNINPEGAVVEELNAPDSFPPNFSAARQTRLRDLIRVVQSAREDQRIVGILLDIQDLDQASLPALQSLSAEIDSFRARGKKVIAYADHYTQTQYLLAAHADELWLHPMGMVLLTGLSSYRNYVREALDRLHVKVHLFRAGSFKSAAEPLVRDSMSDAARQETQAVLQQLWLAYKTDIAVARDIEAADIQSMLDDPKSALQAHHGDPAALAEAMHLVDKLGTRSALLQSLKTGGDEAPAIEFRAYLSSLGSEQGEGKEGIGILTASGAISDGMLGSGGVNGDAFSELVDQATDDDSIRAVVLRIDSPGGSVLASETIRASLQALQQSGKPLVVSMAGMAASGGYWIAAEADEIWTAPTTLTGSIGVFGVFPNLSGGLDKLGIHSDGVGTTATAGAMRPDRPLSPVMADVLQAGVDHIYAEFLDIVGRGRHLDAANVRELAEGRVWSGSDAVRLGLADHLGGIDDAIAAAASRAGLGSDYGIRHILPPQRTIDLLLESLLGDASVAHIMSRFIPFSELALIAEGLRGSHDLLRMLGPRGGIYAYSGFSPS
ncbi:MAG: signal peptide peptidase SppA [Mariprofundaceae bacterium]|nr:signal peptide peptidase SppA [Mariprofundaceae bacterium]